MGPDMVIICEQTFPCQHSPSLTLLRPAWPGQGGIIHQCVRNGPPRPRGELNVASPAGEICGVPPRRSRRAARPHPRRPAYRDRVHHAWTAPRGRPAEREVSPSYGPAPRPAGQPTGPVVKLGRSRVSPVGRVGATYQSMYQSLNVVF